MFLIQVTVLICKNFFVEYLAICEWHKYSKLLTQVIWTVQVSVLFPWFKTHNCIKMLMHNYKTANEPNDLIKVNYFCNKKTKLMFKKCYPFSLVDQCGRNFYNMFCQLTVKFYWYHSWNQMFFPLCGVGF